MYNGGVLDAGGGSILNCRVFGNKLNGILIGDGADPALSGNDVRQNGANGMSLKVPSILRGAAKRLLIIDNHDQQRTAGSHMTHVNCRCRGVPGGMRVTAWLAMAGGPLQLTSSQM